MVVGAKVCELIDGFLWFVCGLYVGILTSPLRKVPTNPKNSVRGIKMLVPCKENRRQIPFQITGIRMAMSRTWVRILLVPETKIRHWEPPYRK